MGKYAEAGPLILSGYEGLKARESTVLPQGKRRLPEAGERVVKLYQSWGKLEKAAEWLEKIKAQGGNQCQGEGDERTRGGLISESILIWAARDSPRFAGQTVSRNDLSTRSGQRRD